MFPFTKLRVPGCLHSMTEAQLPTDHQSILDGPQVITNSAPLSVSVDLHASLVTGALLVPDQPDRSLFWSGSTLRSGLSLPASVLVPGMSSRSARSGAAGQRSGWICSHLLQKVSEILEPVVGLCGLWCREAFAWYIHTN